MKKVLLFLAAMVVFGAAVLAQPGPDTVEQLQKQIIALQAQNAKLLQQVIATNGSLKKLEQRLSDTSDSLVAMKRVLVQSNNNVQKVASELKTEVVKSAEQTNTSISSLDSKLSTTTIFLIIAIILLAVLTYVLFNWIRNKLARDKEEMTVKIKRSYESLREEFLRPENLLDKLKEAREQTSVADVEKPVEIDHTLVLKIADEIIRIRKNLGNIDPETKGLKQIEFAAERIQDYFNEYGYEIVELINKPYDKGLDVLAKFKQDDTVPPGQQIITRIIKPQINYQGAVIQSAEVEVSTGELAENHY